MLCVEYVYFLMVRKSERRRYVRNQPSLPGDSQSLTMTYNVVNRPVEI